MLPLVRQVRPKRVMAQGMTQLEVWLQHGSAIRSFAISRAMTEVPDCQDCRP